MSSSRLSQLLKLSKALPIRLPQNSNLTIRTPKEQILPSISPAPSLKVNVKIIPEWRDDGHITLEEYKPWGEGLDNDQSSETIPSEVQEDQENKMKIDWRVHVENQEVKNELTNVDILIDYNANEVYKKEPEKNHIISGINLIAKVPEKCNVTCHLNQGGNIQITKKLEAEYGFDLYTHNGDIDVSKLRGNKIDLKCETSGLINVKKSCEAQEMNIHIGNPNSNHVTTNGSTNNDDCSHQEGQNSHYNGVNRVRAKMINVSNGSIQVYENKLCLNDHDVAHKLDDDDELAIIDISSVYASQGGDGVHLEVIPPKNTKHSSSIKNEKPTLIECPRKVRVKSNHGHISVRAATSLFGSASSDDHYYNDEQQSSDNYSQRDALVSLGGVNGSFDIALESRSDLPHCTTSMQQQTAFNYPMASNIHIDSLSPGQISVLTADHGDIALTLDRKIEADLNLLSSPMMNNLDPNVLLEEDQNEVVNALIEHDKDIQEFYESTGLSCDTRNENENEDSGVVSLNRIAIETNAFTGHKSAHLVNVEYIHGGIDNKSEEPDSRFDVKTKGIKPKFAASIGKINIQGAAVQALEGFSGNTSSEFERPLIAVGTQGKIKVESLSWFGAISRRYGVKEGSRDLGRQASVGRNSSAKE